MKTLHYYTTGKGIAPFLRWYESLNEQAQIRVEKRLDKLSLGHFGDVKPVGNGVHELRIDYGTGIRVYFANDGNKVILLLTGGDKTTQRKDIQRAKEFYADYKERKSE